MQPPGQKAVGILELPAWLDAPCALPLYEKALRLSRQDPHLWIFHHMRCLALYRLERLEQAEDFFFMDAPQFVERYVGAPARAGID